MNDAQVLLRIQTILQSHLWTAGAGEALFPPGSVLVTSRPSQDVMNQIQPPYGFLRPGPSRTDDEHKGMKWTDVTLTLGHSTPGDPYGESVLVGWGRQEGMSEGAGLLWVQSEALLALKDLSIRDGIEMKFNADTYALVDQDDRTNFIAERDLTFKALCTVQPRYQRPEVFTAQVSGPTVSLAWNAPYGAGHLGYSLRRVGGVTGTAYQSVGVEIGPYTSDKVDATDTPGPGKWTYSLFAGYHSQPGESIIEHWSDCPQITVEVTA